jgi:hypothetical protein
MSTSGRLRRLEERVAAEEPPETEAEREEQRREIRERAEHANNCAYGEPPFEVTGEGAVFCAVDGKPVVSSSQVFAEQSYWQEMEWTAVWLVLGHGPRLTLDGEGVFRTPSGRFAASRDRVDLQGLMGPRAERSEDAVAERWQRLLEDGEVAEALQGLMGMAEEASVPDSYCVPAHRFHDLGEINDRLGNHDLGSIFADAEEREAARRLTWTLTYVPDARDLLSELTGLRDVFVAKGGGGLT